MSAEEITVYTDGACRGNPGPAGLGVVLKSCEGYREFSEYLGRGTNNSAELTAILRALQLITVRGRKRRVRVHTDSKYCIGMLTQGWRAKQNKELIVKLRTTLATFSNVQFEYVPGHQGVALNERADQLATAAAIAQSGVDVCRSVEGLE